jgi:hypothetical protein
MRDGVAMGDAVVDVGDGGARERERHRLLIRPEPNGVQPVDQGPLLAARDQCLRPTDLARQGCSLSGRAADAVWNGVS